MTGSETPDAWIVVLPGNGRDDTRECLQSLGPVADCGARVPVVDNSCTDGTPEQVRRDFPALTVIENGVNRGFAAGTTREFGTPWPAGPST